jgi:hypothetical protein
MCEGGYKRLVELHCSLYHLVSIIIQCFTQVLFGQSPQTIVSLLDNVNKDMDNLQSIVLALVKV